VQPTGQRRKLPGPKRRVPLLARRRYSIQLRGSTLSLIAAGRGLASIDATGGGYSLDGGRRRPLARVPFHVSF
jgi:hypothetical protein